MVGGGEMLRDEQIYLAHKAANPAKYPPGDAFLDEHPREKHREQITKWKPTDVQLQVWDDLCHVAPTLSFTRPAKYMYRSIAQFGAWTLARAQKTDIEITYDDDVSIISKSETDDEDEAPTKNTGGTTVKTGKKEGYVGKAGDPLPNFKRHMIRQRVDRHGRTYGLEPESELPACNLSPSEIGVIKAGPVKKWMAAKREWDTKYASEKRRIQKQRAKDMAEGYREFGNGEVPPPSALAGRRKTGDDLKEAKKTRSMGMSLWALWGSKHDEKAMNNEKETESPEVIVVSPKTAGVPPAADVRTPGVTESGVDDDDAFKDLDSLVKDSDVNDHGIKGRPKDLAEAQKKEELAVENGEVVSAERPPLESFQTAMEVLPVAK
ncbi:putative AB hydrolase superfamily protein C4A8.06c [Glarea lozoyensis 74030]|uniref:Putative AB hydrolase superfamily protein C4A8.06c n=1 Tax=Glarea lozoyensis (strain ATCC 74030 / MF5533) TaxID=1104152 RepID=H0ER43_GLAL7|nr:putative AB hydrolase superfamily protein C4A8.06c [Glarea lozoyensis 74030]